MAKVPMDNSKPNGGWPSAEHEQLACVIEHHPLDAGDTLMGCLIQRVCDRGWAERDGDGKYIPTNAGFTEFYDACAEMAAKEAE